MKKKTKRIVCMAIAIILIVGMVLPLFVTAIV